LRRDCLRQSLSHVSSCCFLSRYRHPAPLHSFPTRRSSDLIDGHGDREEPPRRQAGGPGGGPAGRVPAAAPRHHHRQGAVAAAGRDRKSTRLNSSHGSISYAVFCLKKKTKETDVDSSAPLNT